MVSRNGVSPEPEAHSIPNLIYPFTSIQSPSKSTATLFNAFLEIRRFYLRHLALPRPWFLSGERTIPSPDPTTGRYHQSDYVTFPYYVKPSAWKRYGPYSWFSWLFGTPVPGDEGEKYRPEGYLLEEIGPEKMEGKGKEWMAEERLAVEGKLREGACPFAAMMKR